MLLAKVQTLKQKHQIFEIRFRLISISDGKSIRIGLSIVIDYHRFLPETLCTHLDLRTDCAELRTTRT